MRRYRLLAPCLAWFLCSLHEKQAVAFPYTAEPGDTLASLSERFYGKVELEKVIVAANGFENQVPLLPGMRIEVPAVSFVRAGKTDSWAGLAESLLGNAARAEALALSNETMPWIPPKPGQEIVVPYPLRYVAARGDSTASIAYRFLGKRDHSYVIDRFNDLRGAALEPGDVVLVPVTDLALTDEGREAAFDAVQRVLGETRGEGRDHEERAQRELPRLKLAVRQGQYVEAVALANQLGFTEDMSDEVTAAVLFELVKSYVALGESTLASETCVEWRRHAVEVVLDPVWVSPKVLTACANSPAPKPEASSSASAAKVPPPASAKPRTPPAPTPRDPTP